MTGFNADLGIFEQFESKFAAIDSIRLHPGARASVRPTPPWGLAARIMLSALTTCWWRRDHAALNIPQAAGATDRELARLGADPASRAFEASRVATRGMLDLALFRLR